MKVKEQKAKSNEPIGMIILRWKATWKNVIQFIFSNKYSVRSELNYKSL